MKQLEKMITSIFGSKIVSPSILQNKEIFAKLEACLINGFNEYQWNILKVNILKWKDFNITSFFLVVSLAFQGWVTGAIVIWGP